MSKVSRKLIIEQDKIIREFNRDFMSFIKQLVLKYPDNLEVYRIKSRVSLAKGTDHTILIRTIGEYLKNNESYIKTRNESFYIENIDNIANQEIEKLNKQNNSDYIFYILGLIKTQYLESTENEKNNIQTKLIKMTENYNEYIKLCQYFK